MTDQEIEKMIEKFERVFQTKQEAVAFQEEMRADFAKLSSSVDAYARKADGYFQEMLMLSQKVDRYEKWFHLLADKVGLKLEY